METNFQKLTELQKKVGYKEGSINLIALFGSFGEAGEVLDEWIKQFDPAEVEQCNELKVVRSAIVIAAVLDDFKKQIRDKNSELPELKIANPLGDLFDREIADQLYYLNALAINRGKTLDDYAGISFEKVSAKIAVNVQHGVDNTEMPQKDS